MREEDIFNLITSEPKWYPGNTSDQNASMIKRRYKEKTLSFRALTDLFNYFGYEQNIEWSKKEFKSAA